MASSSARMTRITVISLLSALAFLMQYFNFPLPPFPSFLKVDFSEVPALLAAVIFGPLAGVTVELLKNVIHFVFSGSETGIPIGQISNFVAGSTFVATAGWITRKIPGIKGLVIGMSVAALIMASIMSLANYFVFLPAYAYFIDWTMGETEKIALVLYGIAPFNVIKGILTMFIFIPFYIRFKPRVEQYLIPKKL